MGLLFGVLLLSASVFATDDSPDIPIPEGHSAVSSKGISVGDWFRIKGFRTNAWKKFNDKMAQLVEVKRENPLSRRFLVRFRGEKTSQMCYLHVGERNITKLLPSGLAFGARVQIHGGELLEEFNGKTGKVLDGDATIADIQLSTEDRFSCNCANGIAQKKFFDANKKFNTTLPSQECTPGFCDGDGIVKVVSLKQEDLKKLPMNTPKPEVATPQRPIKELQSKLVSIGGKLLESRGGKLFQDKKWEIIPCPRCKQTLRCKGGLTGLFTIDCPECAGSYTPLGYVKKVAYLGLWGVKSKPL